LVLPDDPARVAADNRGNMGRVDVQHFGADAMGAIQRIDRQRAAAFAGVGTEIVP
jgi:hypothetical protein